MKKFLLTILLTSLLSGGALSEDLEYYCSDTSSSPPNHSWFKDKGELILKPVRESTYKYDISVGSIFFRGIKAHGSYGGRYKNEFTEIGFSFTERDKTGILTIVSKQYSSPVDIRFKCSKKSFLDRIFN